MNRTYADGYSNNETFNRDSATKMKFVATARRALCVSTPSALDENDALEAVGAFEFSTTVSLDASLSNANVAADVPKSDALRKPFAPLGLSGMTLPQIERAAILETLLACKGNRSQTARKLGVSEKTIYNKIKIYRLKAELEAAFGSVRQAA